MGWVRPSERTTKETDSCLRRNPKKNKAVAAEEARRTRPASNEPEWAAVEGSSMTEQGPKELRPFARLVFEPNDQIDTETFNKKLLKELN